MRRCDMTHVYVTLPIDVWHDSCICYITHWRVTCLMYVLHYPLTCDMSHVCVTLPIDVWHDSWVMYIHDSFTCRTPHVLIRMSQDSFWCNMTHSNMTGLFHAWHDSFMCNTTHIYATWLIHKSHNSSMRDMTHSCVTWLIRMWHDSFMCDMTYSFVACLIHVWHASFMPCVMSKMCPCHDFIHVTWLIHIHTTNTYTILIKNLVKTNSGTKLKRIMYSCSNSHMCTHISRSLPFCWHRYGRHLP